VRAPTKIVEVEYDGGSSFEVPFATDTYGNETAIHTVGTMDGKSLKFIVRKSGSEVTVYKVECDFSTHFGAFPDGLKVVYKDGELVVADE
jgi:hypothetical protein